MNMRKGERLKGILAKPAIFILTAALLLQGPGVAFAEETKSGTRSGGNYGRNALCGRWQL